MELITIFTNILMPIIVLISLGSVLHIKFKLDLHTLAKINIYYLVPGLIFIKLYETSLNAELFSNVFIFFIALSVLLHIIAWTVGKLFRMRKSLRLAFSHSALFYNSGNYGVPVNDLVFKHDPLAMAVQVVVLTCQNILVYSYGLITLQPAQKNKLKMLIPYFKMPVTYAMLAGILINVFDITLPAFIYTPGSYIADALIAIALLTLGAQVAQLDFNKNMYSVYLATAVRLAISPLLAFGIIQLLSVDATTAQALFIASAMPSSVNSAIIAQEYENEPEFAAQTVLVTTLLSVVTVTLVIYLSKILFI